MYLFVRHFNNEHSVFSLFSDNLKINEQQSRKDEEGNRANNVTLTQPVTLVNVTESATASSSKNEDLLITNQTVISGFYKNVTEEFLNISSVNATLSTDNATMTSYGNITPSTVYLPDDVGALPCSALDEYGHWTFSYKYTPAQLKQLICRCRGFCLDLTLSPDIISDVHNDIYGALSERNRPTFIAIVTVYSFLLFVGLTGKLLNSLFHAYSC